MKEAVLLEKVCLTLLQSLHCKLAEQNRSWWTTFTRLRAWCTTSKIYDSTFGANAAASRAICVGKPRDRASAGPTIFDDYDIG